MGKQVVIIKNREKKIKLIIIEFFNYLSKNKEEKKKRKGELIKYYSHMSYETYTKNNEFSIFAEIMLNFAKIEKYEIISTKMGRTRFEIEVEIVTKEERKRLPIYYLVQWRLGEVGICNLDFLKIKDVN